MVVQCLWNSGRENQLEIGKEYEVLVENRLTYVLNTRDGLVTTLKERFKIVS